MIKINSKTVIKKYNNTLLFYFSIISIIIIIMVLVFLYVPDDNLVNSINIILLIGLLFFSLMYRNVILGFRNMAQVARVVLKQSKPIKYKSDIYQNKEYLNKNEYELYKDTGIYEIYYKYISLKSYKIFKIRKLKTIVLINESKLDYYDSKLHEDINQLEEKVAKKQKFYKHQMIFIKKFDEIKQEDLVNIGEVVLYNVAKQTFIQINVGLNVKDKKAYFLYSDEYAPSMDYQESVDDIKNIIS